MEMSYSVKVFTFTPSLCAFQWTHTSGGDRDELGCHTGAKDSDQVRRPGICKRE